MLYSGECRQKFWEMLLNIPGNVAKYSGECHQTFRGMSSNITGNVAKHSKEYVLKHSGEFHQKFQGMLPVFGVKENNYRAESDLESCQTSTMELFYKNSQRP